MILSFLAGITFTIGLEVIIGVMMMLHSNAALEIQRELELDRLRGVNGEESLAEWGMRP